MTPRHRPRLRARWLVGGVGLLVAGAIGAWAIIGDVPFLVNPFTRAPVPRFLEASDPRVDAALWGARTPEQVVGHLRAALRAARPGVSDLWRTETGFAEADAVRLWTDGGQIRLLGYEPFHVPPDPTWAEDPEGNISWETYYQALVWLRAPQQAFLDSGDRDELLVVKRYLLDWIADSGATPPPSARTWYDHSVAYRTDVIVELLSGDLWDELTDDELTTVLRSLERHGQLLHAYLDDPEFVGHNHNLFHALSLYNLAVALPVLRDSATWRHDARARIPELLSEMVATDEGVSLEGASAYHFLALQLFSAADRHLARMGDGLAPDEHAVLERMLTFAALLVSPTGELPAIGDTPYGMPADESLLRTLLASGLDSPIAEFVLGRGSAGMRPSDLELFPTSGYALIRPAWSAGEAWTRDLQLVVDGTGRSAAHSHHDAMSLLLTAEGANLLVDSGGPYIYGTADYGSFTAARAHNTVVDLDATVARGGANDLSATDAPDHTAVSGTVRLGPTAELRRVIVLGKPNLVVIVDRVRAEDHRPHRFALYHHLAPGSGVDLLGDSGLVVSGSARMGFRIVSSTGAAAEVVAGLEDPRLGWVTTAYAERRPAPVLTVEVEAETGWFVSAFEPGAAASPEVAVTQRPDGSLDVSIRGSLVDLEVRVDADGTARVAVDPR